MTSTFRLALGAAVVAAAIGAAACAGSSSNPAGPSDPGGNLTPTFASISSQILTPRCTACHSGSAAEAGLNLSAGSAYAALVNVPSSQRSGATRVVPGNADGSYLIQKLRGDGGIVGVRMPMGGPFLSTSEIDVIRQWINAGALQ
jgi:hypothetical protein